MIQKKRILFISFFFEPHNGVGAKRISYWAENISRIDDSFICDVISTTHRDNAPEYVRNYFVVPLPQQKASFALIKDAGLLWKKALNNFFDENKHKLQYDYVLLTGSPFLHFSISKKLKELFDCKIILDFRDPFANNPIFKSNFFKKYFKLPLENSFIKEADAVITVNNYCLNLFNLYNSTPSKFFIIENGFDEEVIQNANVVSLNDKSSLKFVYAGSFSEGRNPRFFLDVVSSIKDPNLITFHYIGLNFISANKNVANVFNHGLKKYLDTIDIVKSADVGLIFTGGKPFESTTKIYEYIGLQKAILIVTAGELYTGAIYEITKDYPLVFWCKNNYTSIRKVLNEMSNISLNVFYPERYQKSRLAGLKLLIEVINKI